MGLMCARLRPQTVPRAWSRSRDGRGCGLPRPRTRRVSVASRGPSPRIPRASGSTSAASAGPCLSCPRRLHLLSFWALHSALFPLCSLLCCRHRCPDLRKAGWLGAVRQRSVLLWDAGVGRACGNIELSTSVRAVTDLHWGDHLVTGAMDGSVRLHDHRDLRQVVAVFGSKSNGHTQVRVNSKVPVLVASAHAGYLLIWDLRHPKKPLSSIFAHVSNKVGKFDWGQQSTSDQIVTCSPMESEVKRFVCVCPSA